MKFCIIGSGPAGTAAALSAARLGHDVTLFASDQLGGVCLNEGCIPTKTLLEDATHLAKTARLSEGFNPLSGASQSLKHKESVVTGLKSALAQELRSAKVQVLERRASFINESTLIDSTGESHTADVFIIATGARPSHPDLGFPDPSIVYDSRKILETVFDTPQRFCVIGGGVIGLELSAYLKLMGHEVRILEAAPRILLNAPKELAQGIERDFKANGIAIHTQLRIDAIRKGTTGTLLETSLGTLEADRILIATGRKPNLEGLGLQNTSIALSKGAIVVDEHYRTHSPNIYAIGDVNGSMQLAHAASDQGEQLIDWLLKGIAPVKKAIPFGLYTPLQAAWVGLGEEEAKADHPEVRIKKVLLTALAKQKIKTDTRGYFKALISPDNRLLGAEILSAEATELIGTCALLIESGLDLKTCSQTVWPHPTLSEAFKLLLSQLS